jgi:hypothetical protein
MLKKEWTAGVILCSRNAHAGQKGNGTRINPLLPECARGINRIMTEGRCSLHGRSRINTGAIPDRGNEQALKEHLSWAVLAWVNGASRRARVGRVSYCAQVGFPPAALT